MKRSVTQCIPIAQKKQKKCVADDTEQEEPMMIYNGYSVPATCSTELLPLARENAHERDKHICFEEKRHLYFVKGRCNNISVSAFIHRFFEEFQAVSVARKMVQRADFKSASRYKKYQHFVEQSSNADELVSAIVQSWNENGALQSKLGTDMHRYIELHNNNVIQPRNTECIEREYYHDYQQKQQNANYIPYRTEWMLWDGDDDSDKLTGTIDMIYQHKIRKTFHMVDWKRSKEIKRFGFKRGKGPCSSLQDCNYIHYSLQLNAYKYLLEKNYGIVIEDMHIVIFHPSNSSYLEIKVNQMRCVILEMLRACSMLKLEDKPAHGFS